MNVANNSNQSSADLPQEPERVALLLKVLPKGVEVETVVIDNNTKPCILVQPLHNDVHVFHRQVVQGQVDCKLTVWEPRTNARKPACVIGKAELNKTQC